MNIIKYYGTIPSGLFQRVFDTIMTTCVNIKLIIYRKPTYLLSVRRKNVGLFKLTIRYDLNSLFLSYKLKPLIEKSLCFF